MNFKLVLSSCLLAAAYGQFVSPKDAKILKEQRFNTGDGRFGSAYAQEDGVVFREETTADGERVGQYSYIDNDGKTITVKYTAGKDGFRILEGDHVPTGANGLNSAAFDPNHSAAHVQAAPLRQVSLPVATVPQSFDYSDYEDIPVDPNFNPFINPHDPTHRNFQHNVNAAQFSPQQPQFAPEQPRFAPQQQQFAPQQPQFAPQQPQFAPQQPQFAPTAHAASSVPACADCAGVNPFINPHDFSHQQGRFAQPSAPVQQVQPAFRQQQFVPQQQQFVAQQQQFAPQQQQFAPQQQQQFVPQQQQFAQQPITESPRRFFPPGQLQLNRFETGFNFDFSS